jgi:predicted transcriptional regulator
MTTNVTIRLDRALKNTLQEADAGDFASDVQVSKKRAKWGANAR